MLDDNKLKLQADAQAVSKEKIKKIVNSDNIIDDLELDDEELREIADEVLEGLDEDELSMEDWLHDADQAMELTDIKREDKNWPFKGAANTKYPLTTLAVVQFSSRTLPELIKNGEVVKYKIIGSDLDGSKARKGDRVKNFLNYQVLEQIPAWLDERDKLLNQLAVVGTCFVKTWWDPRINQVCSELLSYDLVKVNNKIKNLESAPRISQYFYLTKREIIEHIRWDMYVDLDLDHLKEESGEDDCDSYEFVEQHCWLNLLNDDESDYPQPYIVTLHKHSRKVVRIVARFTDKDIHYNKKGRIKSIDPQHFFSDYHFIPSPRNEFFSIGFGTLLLDMNVMTNSLLNQIINCGTLSMTQGGIYNKDSGVRPDDFIVEPGEWIPADSPLGTDLSKSFVPFNYQPPSPVVLELLNVLLNSGKELTSSTEALTGMQDSTNVSPNTLYALIQQGLKVFVAIQRRIMRGSKKELAKIVQLNGKYLSEREYLSVIDIRPEEVKELFDPKTGKFIEFEMQNIDIVPVTDLAVSSEAETLARVNAGIQMYQQGAQVGTVQDIIDARELYKDAFKALNYQNLDALIKPPAQKGPDLNAVKLQSELDMNAKNIEFKARELDLATRKVYIEEQKAAAEALKSKTQGIKNLADADAQDKNVSISAYKVSLDSMARQQEIEAKKAENKAKLGPSASPDGQQQQDPNEGLPSKEEVQQAALARGYTPQ